MTGGRTKEWDGTEKREAGAREAVEAGDFNLIICLFPSLPHLTPPHHPTLPQAFLLFSLPPSPSHAVPHHHHPSPMGGGCLPSPTIVPQVRWSPACHHHLPPLPLPYHPRRAPATISFLCHAWPVWHLYMPRLPLLLHGMLSFARAHMDRDDACTPPHLPTAFRATASVCYMPSPGNFGNRTWQPSK